MTPAAPASNGARRAAVLVLLAVFALAFAVPKASVWGDLKIDDVVFGAASFAGALLLGRVPSAALGLFGLFGLFLGACVVASALHPSADAVLFVGRYGAYFLACVFGMSLGRRLRGHPFPWRRLALVLCAFTFALAALQRAGVLGGIIDGRWLPRVGDRVPGATSHPTEFALLLLLLTFVLHKAYRDRRLDGPYGAGVAAIAGSLLLSDSRTALVLFAAYVLLFLAGRLDLRRRAGRVALALGLLALPVLAGVALQHSRLQDVFRRENLVGMQTVLRSARDERFDRIDPERRPPGMDPSLYVRFTKWVVIGRALGERPLGHGAGSFGVATDGLYLRVLGESGVPGLLALLGLWAWLLRYFRGDRPARLFVLAVALNSITIDTIFFSRFGYMFWFVIGIEIALHAAERRAARRPRAAEVARVA